MTRRVRRSRTKQNWGPGYEMLLLHGHDFFNELNHPPKESELRSAWNDLREKLMDEFLSDNKFVGRRPSGWWLFDSPEPRDDRDEADQLRAMGELTDHEEQVLRLLEAKKRPPTYDD